MNEKQRRILMTVLGVMITGFSVGLLNFSMFGMDPFQVFAHGVWNQFNLGFGTFYTILNLVMLIAVFFIDKKKIGLGTVINIFLAGYAVEFSTWLFASIIPDPTLLTRIPALVVGLIILCFGSALYFTGDMGVSTYDAIAIVLSEKKIAKFKYCRIATDLICTATGYFLGATVGIGTVATAFFMGPLIAFFIKRVAEPLRYGKKTKSAETVAV